MNPLHSPRVLNLVANFLFVVAAVMLLVSAGAWLIARPYFSIRQIEVGAAPGHALRHIPQNTLAQAISRGNYGSFFTIDMAQLRANVEQVPWVRRATVRRIWPDKLVFLLEEHRPYGLWHDGRLLNHYGELFSAHFDERESEKPLPQLGGPVGSEVQVARRYDEIRGLVEPLNIYPVAVELSARRAWTARLSNGTDLLIGREQGVPIADRIARWVQSYALVTERMQRRAQVIDLRYPNGYSVRELEKLADAVDLDSLIAEADARSGGNAVAKPAVKQPGPARPASGKTDKQ